MTGSLWQRLGCCLTGHNYSIASDDTRMFVRCTECGHTSRGLPLAGDPKPRRERPERAAGAAPDGRGRASSLAAS